MEMVSTVAKLLVCIVLGIVFGIVGLAGLVIALIPGFVPGYYQPLGLAASLLSIVLCALLLIAAKKCL